MEIPLVKYIDKVVDVLDVRAVQVSRGQAVERTVDSARVAAKGKEVASLTATTRG